MRRILCLWLPHHPRRRSALGTGLFFDQKGHLASPSLAAWCGRFSPLFGVEEGDNPTSLLLDIGGTAHLFGGEAALAERMVRELAADGWSARLAAADTLGGAWAAAHFGEAARGAILVPPGETAAALRPLPIEALRLPPETVELLHSLGVRRIEQLESLPRRELCSRFGPRLAERWDQAMGSCPEPLPVCNPPPRLAADWSPEHPAAHRENVAAAMERLIRRLAAMLVQCGRGALRLRCRLSILGQSPLEFAVGLFEPTARPEICSPWSKCNWSDWCCRGPCRRCRSRPRRRRRWSIGNRNCFPTTRRDRLRGGWPG